MAAKRRTVILTAGHYGFRSGAWRGWFDEGSETIILRDLITKELRKKFLKVINDSDHERTGHVIQWVNDQANETDLLVEIHFNAVDHPAPSGVECFVQATANEFEVQTADEICRVTSDVLGVPNRKTKTPPQSQHKVIGIIDRTKVQAVLWEVCFMSNIDDVRAYREKQAELAKAIAEVIFKATKL